jgi:hypothetical protein
LTWCAIENERLLMIDVNGSMKTRKPTLFAPILMGGDAAHSFSFLGGANCAQARVRFGRSESLLDHGDIDGRILDDVSACRAQKEPANVAHATSAKKQRCVAQLFVVQVPDNRVSAVPAKREHQTQILLGHKLAFARRFSVATQQRLAPFLLLTLRNVKSLAEAAKAALEKHGNAQQHKTILIVRPNQCHRQIERPLCAFTVIYRHYKRSHYIYLMCCNRETLKSFFFLFFF